MKYCDVPDCDKRAIPSLRQGLTGEFQRQYPQGPVPCSADIDINVRQISGNRDDQPDLCPHHWMELVRYTLRQYEPAADGDLRWISEPDEPEDDHTFYVLCAVTAPPAPRSPIVHGLHGTELKAREAIPEACKRYPGLRADEWHVIQVEREEADD